MRKKISNNSILAACVLVVLTLCLLSVWQPIHFQKEKEQRETAVKQRLMKIRTAEENYKRRHGTYTGDFATLIKGNGSTGKCSTFPSLTTRDSRSRQPPS